MKKLFPIIIVIVLALAIIGVIYILSKEDTTSQSTYPKTWEVVDTSSIDDKIIAQLKEWYPEYSECNIYTVSAATVSDGIGSNTYYVDGADKEGLYIAILYKAATGELISAEVGADEESE